jgi:GTPase
LQAFLDEVGTVLQGARHQEVLHLSFAQGKQRAWLFQQDIVVSENQTEDGFDITVLWTAKQEAQYQAL